MQRLSPSPSLPPPPPLSLSLSLSLSLARYRLWHHPHCTYLSSSKDNEERLEHRQENTRFLSPLRHLLSPYWGKHCEMPSQRFHCSQLLRSPPLPSSPSPSPPLPLPSPPFWMLSDVECAPTHPLRNIPPPGRGFPFWFLVFVYGRGFFVGFLHNFSYPPDFSSHKNWSACSGYGAGSAEVITNAFAWTGNNRLVIHWDDTLTKTDRDHRSLGTETKSKVFSDFPVSSWPVFTHDRGFDSLDCHTAWTPEYRLLAVPLSRSITTTEIITTPTNNDDDDNDHDNNDKDHNTERRNSRWFSCWWCCLFCLLVCLLFVCLFLVGFFFFFFFGGGGVVCLFEGFFFQVLVAKVQYVIQAEHSTVSSLWQSWPKPTAPPIIGSASVWVYLRLPLSCQLCCVLGIVYRPMNSFSYGLFACILSRNFLPVFDFFGNDAARKLR